MPATLLTETQWHGNPRGEPVYAWTVYVEDVPSPYYADGRDVPVYAYGSTDTPFSGYPEAANTDSTVTLTGTWYRGTGLDVAITATDATPEDTPVNILYVYEPGGPYTATEAAAAYVAYFNAEASAVVTASNVGAVITFAPAGDTVSLVVDNVTVSLP